VADFFYFILVFFSLYLLQLPFIFLIEKVVGEDMVHKAIALIAFLVALIFVINVPIGSSDSDSTISGTCRYCD